MDLGSPVVHNPYSFHAGQPNPTDGSGPDATLGTVIAAQAPNSPEAKAARRSFLCMDRRHRLSKINSQDHSNGLSPSISDSASLSVISSAASSSSPNDEVQSSRSFAESSDSGTAEYPIFVCDPYTYCPMRPIPTAIPHGACSPPYGEYYPPHPNYWYPYWGPPTPMMMPGYTPVPYWGYPQDPFGMTTEPFCPPIRVVPPNTSPDPFPAQSLPPQTSAAPSALTQNPPSVDEAPPKPASATGFGAMPIDLMRIATPKGLSPTQRHLWRMKVAAEAPCDHFTAWRRLRTRRRMDQLFCSLCEAKWRICNRSSDQPPQSSLQQPAEGHGPTEEDEANEGQDHEEQTDVVELKPNEEQ